MKSAVDEHGAVSLEAALVLPVLFLAVLVALQGLVAARAVLVAHEAARAGARAAATSTGTTAAASAAHEAGDGLDLRVGVVPSARGPGDLVTVTVTVTDQVGPAPLQVSATSVARVEPGVGAVP